MCCCAKLQGSSLGLGSITCTTVDFDGIPGVGVCSGFMTGTLNLGVGFAESEAGFGFGGGAKLFGGVTGGIPILPRGIGLVGTVGLVGRASVGEEIGLGGAIGRAGTTGKAEDAGIAGGLVVVGRTGTLKTGPFLVPTALVPPALCVGAAL